MRSIPLQRTRLTVSRIAFGTASLHHLSDAAARTRLLQAAVDAGISHFDTAPYYGFGLAETALAALAAHGDRVTIATKVGLYPPGGTEQSRAAVLARKLAGKLLPALSKPIVDLSVATARASLDGSLRRLRRERVDLLLLHEPDRRLFAADEWQRWVETERGGRFGAIGISGEAAMLLPFIAAGDAVAQVVQARDSVAGNEAAPLRAAGCSPQITFGHLARLGAGADAPAALRQAAAQQPGTVLLVSTRRVDRIAALASAAAAG